MEGATRVTHGPPRFGHSSLRSSPSRSAPLVPRVRIERRAASEGRERK